MMKYNGIAPVALCLFLLLMTGCGKQDKRPEGYPEIYPITVQVNEKGQPFPNAGVRFESNSALEYAIVGTTDETGKAVLETAMGSYIAAGCPLGTYKVTISKFDREEVDKLIEQQKQLPPEVEDLKLAAKIAAAESSAKPLVPKQLLRSDMTPIEVTVDESSTAFTFDVNEYK
ncbi:MAG: hypothetical protein Q4G68_02510 [Planctomycetia bacterium]|nr:hypothetical protein [Planctomycetia bacterium]